MHDLQAGKPFNFQPSGCNITATLFIRDSYRFCSSIRKIIFLCSIYLLREGRKGKELCLILKKFEGKCRGKKIEKKSRKKIKINLNLIIFFYFLF